MTKVLLKIIFQLGMKFQINNYCQVSLLILFYTQSFSPQFVPPMCKGAPIFEPALTIFIVLAQLYFKSLLFQ